MDATSAPPQSATEYEFLDLTDINEEERSSLTSALFASAPTRTPIPSGNWPTGDKVDSQVAWTDPNYVVNDGVDMTTMYVLHSHTIDLSSCSSGTPGPPTASSSLDSLTATEREMAPHSPQRNAPAQTTVPQPSPLPVPHSYAQPPPPMYNAAPQPNHHWSAQHLIPPSVYVSQVTANVNVHGYMSQYYQPQYTPHPPPENRGRDGRDRGKGRRGGGVKRAPSPPHPYLYYQYYPTPQTAQGAPLYHVPVYPPMGYVSAGYPYVPYMDYSMMEDPNQTEKGPEEYQPELMMEQEHVPHEMFYPQHAACLPQTVYDPNRPMEGVCSLEGYPAYFPMPPPPPVSHVHQFNVHAKNFVRQSDHKSHNQQMEPKVQENVNQMKAPQNNPSVEQLPIKDLKISNKQGAQKQNQEKGNVNSQPLLKNPPPANNDKIVPKPAETPNSGWNANKPEVSNKTIPVSSVVTQAVTSTASSTPTTNKALVPTNPLVPPNKANKTPNVVPFTNNKTFVKTISNQQLAGVIMPQQGLPSKAPFASKSKKDATQAKNQEVFESAHSATSTNTAAPTAGAAATVLEVKQGATTKPAPVAIAVHNQTSAPITSKAPFSHNRKPSVSAEVSAPVTTPLKAPTESDFPPPPAPRRPAEQSNTPTAEQTPPAPVVTPSSQRTWASLFVQSTTPAASQSGDSNQSGDNINSTVSSGQKPVAKVGPYDASPIQQEAGVEKSGSDKLSNSKPNQKSHKKDGSVSGDSQTPLSTHMNDPLAYTRGEFLSEYQLNHHAVSLQPRGLCNRSNYCYINAILQALIACPPFYNMLKSLPSTTKRGKSSTPIIDSMVELCGEFSPLPSGARAARPDRSSKGNSASTAADSSDSNAISTPPVGVGMPFEPSTVLHMLRDMNNGDSFRVEGRQEDAEEFLGCLLNGLNDEMLELIKLYEPEESKTSPVTVNGNDACHDSDDDEEWKVMGPKNKGSVERRCLAGRTPLSDIFRGQLCSRLQRATDTAASDTTHCVQPFFTLPLDIERSSSVREALERLAYKDRLEGVTCPSRGRPVEAWQQVLLDRLPIVLLLHLKCFHCRPEDGATVKIVKTVEYPVDLKIDPKILSSKVKYNVKQRTYKLFAVVYHEGSEAEKGHYLTDAYHVGCGGWLRYDDSVVSSVTEQHVLHPRTPRTPYLLLYRRQDTMQMRHTQN